ncbi:MAG: hypothetical protein A2845_03205 [Candidatus Lloydbacteria bacterium RIFCSPHIGHO2_01_FULL_49_22]|uniref:Outer membrane protein beta-barrel domain-containing protein n=1 Tax=Candidatus Lloydbacteria bacterium RIFCSPHIGHO2_01_FULL_49_22 TaxID=1798658 RepID=A0A1G2CY43_9BACT|nr:MAG: hypothetical protein A2845_03205 [Candidatus Lloydbacteria bacterium RIFCSPHIGHO2_01_FULL_49_22]OGZ09889.1 MAG: hypothetical protein A3C14_03045 [Candidatus Lloydbacteria bacterium RIFCSPHIGHO2_02_FULL_50_18]
MFIKMICAGAIVLGSGTAFAQGVPVGTWQLQTGGFSYHMPHDSPHNEVNLGLGVEYQLNSNTAISAGFYKNSFGLRSNYAFAHYHPWEIWGVRVGATMGYVDGYPNYQNGAVGSVILPSFSKQYKHFGIYGIVIPPVSNGQGLIFVGIKIPFKELGRLFD